MRRVLLLAALLVLLATTSVLAALPPAIWFQYNFETFQGSPVVAGVRLAWCPGWGETAYQSPGVIEPGKTSSWPSQNVDCHIGSGTACSPSQYAVMQGWRHAWSEDPPVSLTDPKAACAQTNPAAPPTGVGWSAYADGCVQILNFKMVKPPVTNQEPDPPLHAAVYLMDDREAGAKPIMGWVFSTKVAMPQVHLPTYQGASPPAPGWTTNRYYYPEPYGEIYNWTDPVGTCREFTAVYDPSDGSAKFYYRNNANTADILLWTATAASSVHPDGKNRVSQSVYVRDYGWTTGYGAVDVVCLDDLAVGGKESPGVTSPVGGAFITTNTPTIQWTHALTTPLPTKYQVRVCGADYPTTSVVYDSGELSGSATSKQTTALTLNVHYWAFVREEVSGRWTPWSPLGNGGFIPTTVGVPVVSVSSPSGTVVGAKPAVIFTGSVHDQFRVKITTDLAGSVPIWPVDPEAAPPFTSPKYGASCPTMLTPGTQYYAFAKAHNGDGWGNWSAGSGFQVTRTGEGTDFRGMEETWGSESVLDHRAAAPDDGFGTYCGTGSTWAYVKRQVLPDPLLRDADTTGRYPTDTGLVNGNPVPCDWWPTGCADESIAYCAGLFLTPYTEIKGPNPPRSAPSYIIDLWSTLDSNNANCMRVHRVANIDLDKGVTFMTYASGHSYEGAGSGTRLGRTIAEAGQIYIMDDYGTGKCMASFAYGKGEAGICTNNATWTMGYFTDDQHGFLPSPPDPPNTSARPGQGWHVVRITGRNAVVGDPTTTVWKYYLDENAAPLITATGSMDQGVAYWAWPSDPVPVGDAVAVGNGAGRWIGNYQYDWTGVNTNGDYAPGQWIAGPSYPTISAARAARVTGPCSITGNTVITAVMIEGESCSQVGFSVQDVDTKDHAGMYIASSTSTNVAVGNKVSGISGLSSWDPGIGLVLHTPTFTATDVAPPGASPLAMVQKSLHGVGHTGMPGTENGGMFVRITGRVKQILTDDLGEKVVYLDDGSGLIDGRDGLAGDPSALGVRVVFRNTCTGFLGSIGDYYRIDGICACETWGTKTVETLLGATATEIPEP